uniref:Uncharacterized protein n=2 Tax=Arion vulgaris TaxID=1028688 RepID=A0A0B7AXR1_9EUPU
MARKVRISLPDQSNFVLQSLGQFNEKSNSNQPQPVRSNDFRRHSVATERFVEPLNKSEVYPKFNSRLTQQALMITKPEESNTDKHFTSSDNSHSSTTDTTSDTTAISTSKNSSPHLSILPSFLGNQQKDSVEGSNIISQYIRRRQSHSDLLTVSEYKGESGDGTTNKPSMPSSLPSDAPKPLESNLSGTSIFGFSILSRTRQFGAWLTKATEGEKVVVTKKDLNTLAPNSF